MTRVTDSVVILTCLALLAIVAHKYYGASDGEPSREISAIENVIPLRTAFDRSLTQPVGRSTVLLFLHSQCRFCTDSMPLYRDLAARSRREPEVLTLRVRGIEPFDILRNYLDSHGLSEVPVESPGDMLGLTRTPALVVLDQSGRVVASWAGLLSERQVQRLWDMLR